MRQIKLHLQKILLWLLKKLNMPKIFAQFSLQDLNAIESILIKTVKLPMHRRSDINDKVALLEYSISQNTDANVMEQHYEAIQNPIKSINIFAPDFKIEIVGFSSKDTEYIDDVARRYLENNDFIKANM